MFSFLIIELNVLNHSLLQLNELEQFNKVYKKTRDKLKTGNKLNNNQNHPK
jgi:hypothetical protein